MSDFTLCYEALNKRKTKARDGVTPNKINMPQAGINYNEEEMEKAMKPFSEMFNKTEDKPQVSEPIAKEENPKSSIYWALIHALEHCNELSKTERSRELSLVITKIEEAQMWYDKIYPPKGF